jgi:hypothetical protein
MLPGPLLGPAQGRPDGRQRADRLLPARLDQFMGGLEAVRVDP